MDSNNNELKPYRCQYMSFRVSRAEKQTIQDIANEKGIDVSTYLRDKALDGREVKEPLLEVAE